MAETEQSIYLVDDYVNVKPGEPFRLFPFGRIVKNGRKRDITPEVAGKFRLPHFKPPLKLGSHEETTPAGGHIVGLEVRGDGLYAVPELTDKGAQALADGAYRYHSPEVIWEGGGLEDPVTGEVIPGPLIVGDAFLHTPHLGEAAALYSVEPIITEENDMDEEMVRVPKTLWEKFEAWFTGLLPAKPAEEPEVTPEPAAEPVAEETVTEAHEAEPVQQVEDYAAIAAQATAERDQFKAQLEALQAQAAHKARVDAFAAQLSETKVGEGAEVLAAMSDEHAAWVVGKFKALSAQIALNDQIAKEIGTEREAESVDPTVRLDLAVKAYMAEKHINYPDAFSALQRERPELFK